MVDKSEYRIKDKIRKCYKLLNDISEDFDKKYIINFLSKFNITYIKIYKIKEEDLLKLKDFFINELKYKNYKHVISNLNNNDSIFELNLKKDFKDIPIPYPGSKKGLVKNIFNIFKQLGPKKTYIDMYSGSLLIPYLIRNINKDIEIICYENNPYLVNFYNILKNNISGFIKKYKDIINMLKKEENPKEKIKVIIKEINNLDNISKSVWYYIAINTSYYNVLKYSSKDILLNINNKYLDKLLNIDMNIDINKFTKFSDFLKTIELNCIDINNNYNNIFERINKDTITYIDPPYYDKFSNRIYFSKYNEMEYIKLKQFNDILTKNGYIFIKSNCDSIFIRNLYNNYNIEQIDINTKMKKNTIRKELLITNFDYSKCCTNKF